MAMQTTESSNPSSPPGTIEYLPDLLERARAAHPDIPVDSVILQCLLLCLIAQAPLPPGSAIPPTGLHLILRTKDDDVGLVVNLVALILQHILGISTHKHKVNPKVTPHHTRRSQFKGKSSSSSLHSSQTERPDAFLRSLFFRRARRTSMSSHRSSTPRPRSGVSVDATPRSGPVPIAPQWRSPLSNGHVPQPSASYSALDVEVDDDDKHFDASSMASSRRPLLGGQGYTPASTVRSRGSRGRPSAHRLRTDPLPLSSLFTPPNVAETTEDPPLSTDMSPEPVRPQKGVLASLPKAVVVSGLEHTSAPAQRALMRALAERRVIFDRHDSDEPDHSGQEPEAEDGTWNLPDGFVMIYVCKWDPHERPPILRGLVDRFSMSADITLAASVRDSYQAYRTAHNPTPRGTPIPSPLALPHPSAPSPVHHSPIRRTTPIPAPAPPAPPALPASELARLRTLARPYPTAAPIFYPSVYATTQLHAVTPLPPPPPPYAALHPSLDLYLLDLFAATRHHPALDGTLLTMRAHADAEALARAFRVLNGDTVGAALVYHEARAARRGQDAVVPDNVDGASWADAWRSTESVVAGGSRETGRNLDSEKGQHEYGARVRVRVDDEDGSHRSFSAGDEEFAPVPEVGATGQGVEMSPAEALDVAIARSWPEVWDVSEEDVARIFPRVVSHRLRVRDGPDDEILGSVMWPAVPPEVGTGKPAVGETTRREDGVAMGWERKSVKDILVRILADV